MFKLSKGLEIPIAGDPEQVVEDAKAPRSVAIVGLDYPGMKPTMAVSVGDRVNLGQLLFTDKKTEGVGYTAPAGGTISAIHRGYKRALLSTVIDVDHAGEEESQQRFQAYSEQTLEQRIRPDQVCENLINSGLWTAFRTRPYGRVPAPQTLPNSIFVNAMDTSPLAADPRLALLERGDDFNKGLLTLCRLMDGKVFVCFAPNADRVHLPESQQISRQVFSGPHPAGMSSTHIHFLDPVSAKKTVWAISYQDVIAIGHLFQTGRLDVSRIISLAGPQVKRPRLLRTRLGVSIDDLLQNELKDSGDNRAISGSVLAGRDATSPGVAFLGRYHNQISVLEAGRARHLFGWLSLGLNQHSSMGIYLSSWLGGKRRFAMNTSTNGSERAMVPTGNFERVTPMDLLPTQLLRALIVQDTVSAQELGCLELDEEDMGLFTYVCSGKYEYGPILRGNLARIEHEG